MKMKQSAKEKEIIEGVGGGDAFTDVEDKIKGNGSTHLVLLDIKKVPY